MGSRRTWTFRPTLQILEDRITPAVALRTFGGPATHLQVIVPAHVTAGTSFTVEVDAKDARGLTATSFLGPVQLALGTPDAGAIVPASFTYTAADAGVHFFQVTLSAAGTQTIKARPTATSVNIAGNQATTTVVPGSPTRFMVTAPAFAATSAATAVTVSAVDASGNVIPNYTGPVTLAAPNSNMPATYNFVPADHGKHTFQVKFTTPGSESVTASDPRGVLTTGQSTFQVYTPGKATHFSVIALGPAYVNAPTLVQVVALDAVNNIATGYLGVVHIAGQNVLTMPDYGFTSSDFGSHIFQVDFLAPGTQMVTVSDTALASIFGSTQVSAIQGASSYWGWNSWGYGYGYGSAYGTPYGGLWW